MPVCSCGASGVGLVDELYSVVTLFPYPSMSSVETSNLNMATSAGLT
jgi:hypothetical protein